MLGFEGCFGKDVAGDGCVMLRGMSWSSIIGVVGWCVEWRGGAGPENSGVRDEDEVVLRVASIWGFVASLQLAIEKGWDWKGFVLRFGK